MISNESREKLRRYLNFKKEYSRGSSLAKEYESATSVLCEIEQTRYTNENEKKQMVNSSLKESISVPGTSKDHSVPLTDERSKDCTDLLQLSSIVNGCKKCSELSISRKSVVFGSGDQNAGIVVVGEAPGAEEDLQGLPFVGRAGKLLTDILAAIQLSREEVYICNILKCRPPENRNPFYNEIQNCEPYLTKQLELIKPKMILALGTFAAQTLLRTKEPLGKLRGKFHTYRDIKLLVTYHPAALLRNPNWKRPAWEDVKMFRAEYDRLLSGAK